MASIKDVAKRAGVSISTVSNVINGTKHVSDKLKQKILDAINELNYEVDPVARSLKSKKTMTIGVIITSINRIFFPQVLRGIQDEASRNGYNITFYNTDDSFEKERHYIQMLENNWVDGIIVDSVADSENKDYFLSLLNLGSSKKRIPVISLERRIDGFGIGSVAVNNHFGGRIATQHLIEQGCKKIVHITGPSGSCMAQERLSGYKEELLKNRLNVDNARICEGDFSPPSGYQAMKQLLISGIEVDGVFAANDQMAIGAIKAIKEHGYRIPEDIKVVGFDNSFIASIVEPSLTTVNVPKYKLGAMAVQLLLKRINGDSDDLDFVELPINLIVRQSTDLHGDKNWDLYGW